MRIPQDLLYTRDHEWAKIEGDIVTVGISDYAQDKLGEIVYLELPDMGDKVEAGQSFGTVESTKAASDLYAPFSGEVIGVNSALTDEPGGINEDPYGDRWMIRLRVADFGPKADLMDAAAYAAFVAEQDD